MSKTTLYNVAVCRVNPALLLRQKRTLFLLIASAEKHRPQVAKSVWQDLEGTLSLLDAVHDEIEEQRARERAEKTAATPKFRGGISRKVFGPPFSKAKKCPECHIAPPGHKLLCKTGNAAAKKSQDALERRYRKSLKQRYP